jgi:hypothetical protein
LLFLHHAKLTPFFLFSHQTWTAWALTEHPLVWRDSAFPHAIVLGFYGYCHGEFNSLLANDIACIDYSLANLLEDASMSLCSSEMLWGFKPAAALVRPI